MKKLIYSIILLICTYSVSGQVYTNNHNYGNGFTRIANDSSDRLPVMTYPHMSTNLTGPGFIIYNTTDSSIYTFDGTNWHKIGSGSGTGVDTTAIHNYGDNYSTVFINNNTGGSLWIGNSHDTVGGTASATYGIDGLHRPIINNIQSASSPDSALGISNGVLIKYPLTAFPAFDTFLTVSDTNTFVSTHSYTLSHSGSVTYDFKFLITNTPDTTQKITLWNGAQIAAQYTTSSAVAIPFFFGKNVHLPIVLNNDVNSYVTYTAVSGIFSYPFQNGDIIAGQFEYSAGGGADSSSGVMSANEFAYWQTQAVLLDPSAYVLYDSTAIGDTIIVPNNETWYSLSGYQVGDAYYHQREGNVNQVFALKHGTLIIPSQAFYAYICEPMRVMDTDMRYWVNPKELYYSRIHTLDSLSVRHLEVSFTTSMTAGQTVSQFFPAGTNKVMVVNASVYDASWCGMAWKKTIGGVIDTLGTINLQDEINNQHSKRFAHGLRFPCNANLMIGFTAAAGNYSGTIAAATQGGAVLYYVTLPNNW